MATTGKCRQDRQKKKLTNRSIDSANGDSDSIQGERQKVQGKKSVTSRYGIEYG